MQAYRSKQMEELNLQMFSWMDMDKFEMQLIEFQSSSIWKQKFIDLRVELEKTERRQLEKVIEKCRTRIIERERGEKCSGEKCR